MAEARGTGGGGTVVQAEIKIVRVDATQFQSVGISAAVFTPYFAIVSS